MTINNFKIDDILKKESVTHDFKVGINPLFYVGIFLLAGYFLFKFGDFFFKIEESNKVTFIIAEIILIAVGIFICYQNILDLINSELVITDKRVIYKNGFVKQIISIPFGKIQEMYLISKDIPFFGFFFNVHLICKQEKNFISSYHFKLNILQKDKIEALEKIIIEINDKFKSDSGGKIENISINSKKYLFIDLATALFAVICILFLFL